MEFTSLYLAVFAIISVFIYYILGQTGRIILLNLLSLGFIATLNLNLLLYILGYTVVNYSIGLIIGKAESKKLILWFGIGLNLLQLILLKYVDFTIKPLFQLFDSGIDPGRFSEIIVPIGISYFTFQGIGYLVNIKMGWEKPERKILDFLLYITFYPKFLSGPIERSNHFLPQLKKKITFDKSNLTIGFRLILFGLFKKLIIANHLSAFVTTVYGNSDTIAGEYVWILILVQPLYLYFDFSGYTDIAIGYARLYGINLIPNFNSPYLAENVTNFWKRFHISLSSWFNDYVFKQLMFRLRRWKTKASLVALFVTWTLFGIWHGAGWNFMILGFVFALAMIYEFFTRKQRYKLFAKLPDFPRVWIGRFSTYLFYGTALIFFFSPDLNSTFSLFGNLGNLNAPTELGVSMIPMLFGVLVSMFFIGYEILQNDYGQSFNKLMKVWNGYRFLRYVVYYALVVVVISEMGNKGSFVYEMF